MLVPREVDSILALQRIVGLTRLAAPATAIVLATSGALAGATLGWGSDGPDAVQLSLRTRPLGGYAEPLPVRSGPFGLRGLMASGAEPSTDGSRPVATLAPEAVLTAPNRRDEGLDP